MGIRGLKEEVDQDFLRFYFLSNQFIREFNDRIVTTVQPSIKLSSLFDIKITLPSLAEQKSLRQDLLAMTDKIELLRNQNDTLIQIARSIFDKLFVANIEDFENIPLQQEYTFVKGDRASNEDYSYSASAGLIRYIRVKDMDKLRPHVFVKVAQATQRCERKDLLISFDGTVGKMSFGVEGTYAIAIRKIVSANEHYNALGFKYILFSRPEIIGTIKSHASGTVILHAAASIKHLFFPLPPPDKVAEFNITVDPLFDRILLNQKSIIEVEDMLKVSLANIIGE